MNLTPLARARAYTLSGGERRRAEITRALVVSPRFILLDEPFAGIDPIAVTDIQKIIFHLKERGIDDFTFPAMFARRNKAYKEKYGEAVPAKFHPMIRSEEACFLSSSFAIGLARKHGTKLHILHISTERETSLFDATTPLDIERHWREIFLLGRAALTRSTEIRGLSALDIALWDIAGKLFNAPLYRLLGGWRKVQSAKELD